MDGIPVNIPVLSSVRFTWGMTMYERLGADVKMRPLSEVARRDREIRSSVLTRDANKTLAKAGETS